MMGELELGSNVYEAWHSKTDTLWSVEAADLHSLALNLQQCAAEADAFGAAWEKRAERERWANLDTM